MNYQYSLSRKNVGPCKELIGEVHPIFVFVSTPDHPWDEENFKAFYQEYYKARDLLISEAARYGVSLSIKSSYFNQRIVREYQYKGSWFDEVLEKLFSSKDHRLLPYYEKYQKEFAASSTPFFFVFNSPGRSYALASNALLKGFESERVIMFYDLNKNAQFSIAHELLHLYGAFDLYYPEYLKNAAKTHYSESIMYSDQGNMIDSLTAYLIGWSKAPDEIATYFLDLIETNKGISL